MLRELVVEVVEIVDVELPGRFFQQTLPFLLGGQVQEVQGYSSLLGLGLQLYRLLSNVA